MCEPVSIGLAAASILMSVAGSQYNAQQQAKNQNRAIGAKNDAVAASMQRQSELSREAAVPLDKAVSRFEGPVQTATQAGLQDKRASAMTGNLDTKGYDAAAGAAQPSVVQTEIARKMGDALRAGRASAQRQAALQAFGDMGFENNLAFGTTRNALDLTSDKAAGVARLLPIQIQSGMQNSQKRIGPLGDILKAGGAALGMYGAAGAPGLASSSTITPGLSVGDTSAAYGAGGWYM